MHLLYAPDRKNYSLVNARLLLVYFITDGTFLINIVESQNSQLFFLKALRMEAKK